MLTFPALKKAHVVWRDLFCRKTHCDEGGVLSEGMQIYSTTATSQITSYGDNSRLRAHSNHYSKQTGLGLLVGIQRDINREKSHENPLFPSGNINMQKPLQAHCSSLALYLFTSMQKLDCEERALTYTVFRLKRNGCSSFRYLRRCVTTTLRQHWEKAVGRQGGFARTSRASKMLGRTLTTPPCRPA